MKKTLVVLAVVAALAGCAGRDRDTGTNVPGTTPAAVESGPGTAPPVPDLGSVDTDLSSVDSLLNEVDDELAAVDRTPEDAD